MNTPLENVTTSPKKGRTSQSQRYICIALYSKCTSLSPPPILTASDKDETSNISRPPSEQHRQIPLIRRLLYQLVHRSRHAQTLTQLLRHDRQRPIRFPGLIVILLPFRPSLFVISGQRRVFRLRVLHLLQPERGQRPLVERIVPEHVQDGHDAVGFVAQGFEGEFAAAAEDAFGFGDAHPVDQIPGQTERDDFGDVQDPALFKRDAQVNVHHFASLFVQ